MCCTATSERPVCFSGVYSNHTSPHGSSQQHVQPTRSRTKLNQVFVRPWQWLLKSNSPHMWAVPKGAAIFNQPGLFGEGPFSGVGWGGSGGGRSPRESPWKHWRTGPPGETRDTGHVSHTGRGKGNWEGGLWGVNSALMCPTFWEHRQLPLSGSRKRERERESDRRGLRVQIVGTEEIQSRGTNRASESSLI